MARERAIRVALAFGAALPLLWLIAATTDIRQSAPASAVHMASGEDVAAAAHEEPSGLVRLFESALAFVREISRGFVRGDDTGAVVRLLIIVEVLIAALGAVACVTVGGKVKADLVYRIIDVMGALFILITLLLLGMAVVP